MYNNYTVYHFITIPLPGSGFAAEVAHPMFSENVIGPTASSKRVAEQMAPYRALQTWDILQTEPES